MKSVIATALTYEIHGRHDFLRGSTHHRTRSLLNRVISRLSF